MHQLIRLKVRMLIENNQLISYERSEEPLCILDDDEMLEFLKSGVNSTTAKRLIAQAQEREAG